MNRISVVRLGLAVGATAAVLYVGCALVIMTVNREAVVLFFNSLFHGFDVGPIVKTSMSWWQMCTGLIETLILGWLTGASIASFYNLGARPKDRTD